MKNRKIIFILIIFCLYSCDNDDQTEYLTQALMDCQEASEYEAELMIGIDKAISSTLSIIESTHKYQDEFDKMRRASKITIIKKISQIEKSYIDSRTEISNLIILLGQKKSAYKGLLKHVIHLEKEIISKETYIKQIKEEINKKVGKEVDIFQITHSKLMNEMTKKLSQKIRNEYDKIYDKKIENLNLKLAEKDTTISQQSDSLSLKKLEIKAITEEAIIDLKKMEDSLLNVSDKEQAKIFYRMAKEQEMQASKFIDIIGRNKKRATLIYHALMYYKKSTKLGRNCEDEINNLQERYYKYFKSITVEEIRESIEKKVKKKN